MHPCHREVQGGLFVGLEIEVGQVVVLAANGVAGLLLPTDVHGGDGHAPVAKCPLVPLEGLAAGLTFPGVAGHLGGDLAQRLGPLVEQHQHQVRQSLQAVHHRDQRRRRCPVVGPGVPV